MVDENSKLTDCYYEKKDWRACKDEVRRDLHFQGDQRLDGRLTHRGEQMEKFRQCWKAQGNETRTDMKNA